MDEQIQRLAETLQSAVSKIKTSMDSGPAECGGESATLTPNECTVLYRLMTEQCGLDFSNLAKAGL